MRAMKGTESMRPVAPGVAERYDLIEPLGVTILATTYMARERATGVQRVVQVPRAVIQESSQPFHRFRDVAERVRQIEHPHLLPVHEVGSEGNQVWVIYKLEESPTVRDLLQEGISLGKALDLVSQVAEGLDAAHQAGITHGDIQPSNVFWRQGSTALLMDFGAALLAEGVHPLMRESLTTPQPSYLAPELAHGGGPTQASDIYALGCLFYEMVTGQPPFFGTIAAAVFAKQRAHGLPIPSSINPALPATVSAAILRSLEYNPAERYASAAEMARSLKETLSGLTRTEANLVVPPALRRSEAPSLSRLRRSHSLAEKPTAQREERSLDGFIRCPVCLLTNPADNDYCFGCWFDLSGLPVLDMRETRRQEGGYRRKRLVGRILRYGTPSLATLLLIAWVAIPDRPPGEGLPPPISSISAISAEGEWVSYGHDPQATGFVHTSFPVPTGQIRWRTPVGAPLTSSPVAAGGSVFVTTSNNRIIALEQETGEVLWEFVTTGPVAASPVVAGDLLFIGQFDAHILALRTSTGEVAWDAFLTEQVIRSMTVMDGVVYVAGLNGTVYALDASTGEERWSLFLASSIRSAPVIGGGLLALATGDRHLYMVNAQTGKIHLDYIIPRAADASPAIDQNKGVVYVGTNLGTLHAVDIHARNKPLEKGINRLWAQLYIWGYFPAPLQSGWVWTARLGDRVRSSPAVAHGMVYAGAENGQVHARDSQTGARRWIFATGGPVREPLSVVNDLVFAISVDGNLYALDAQTGQEQWRFSTSDGLGGGIAYARGLLFVPSRDGSLYALE